MNTPPRTRLTSATQYKRISYVTVHSIVAVDSPMGWRFILLAEQPTERWRHLCRITFATPISHPQAPVFNSMHHNNNSNQCQWNYSYHRITSKVITTIFRFKFKP